MNSTWKLAADSADLAHGALAGKVEPAQPAAGMHHLAWQNSGLEATRIFTVGWATGDNALGPVAEAFVREKDLVVVHAEQPGRALRVQLYWRAIECACELPAASGNPPTRALLPGLELMVSVQTSLLDSQPALRVMSSFGWERGTEVHELLTRDAASEHWDFSQQPLRTSTANVSTGAYLMRWSGRDVTFAQMIYPSDFESSELRWAGCNGPMECGYTLFQRPLEKGVIRRARIRGLFIPRVRDLEWAAVAMREFALSPLPLTA